MAREVRARGLSVKLKAPGAWIARTETLTDDALPNTAASAELCNFLEEANRDIEEEREARQEGVRIKSALDSIVGVWNSGR